MVKTRNTTMKLIALVTTLAAAAAIWTIWGASRAEAVIAIIRQTGNFSLAQGQATTAHVVNTGEERGITVEWRILDSEGNVHLQFDRRRVELGQASSALWYLPPTEGQRMAIRLELRVEGASSNKPGFIATQEVYNVGDGKTTVFLPYIE